jgi:hypothetical protein
VPSGCEASVMRGRDALAASFDVVMAASVIIAGLSLFVWFFFFAEQSSIVQQYLD